MKGNVAILMLICSSFSMAEIVTFINNNDNIKYKIKKNDSNPSNIISCNPSDGIDKATLKTMISNKDDVTGVCTSGITDFSNLFDSESDFNQDISKWDVSNGTNFNQMFYLAKKFNQDISKWDVSKGNSFIRMFHWAESFNQDIGNWDMSNATNISQMFTSAYAFNQDIGKWNVSNVTSFRYIFHYASNFNQDVHLWNVYNSTDSTGFRTNSLLSDKNTPYEFGGLLQDSDGDDYYDHEEAREGSDPYDASDYYILACVDKSDLLEKINNNRDVRHADTSCLTDLSGLFRNNKTFNQDISKWDVSNVTNFQQMFNNADAFNQDIGRWNVSSGINFNQMFESNNLFNQDISKWDVSNGLNFYRMFNYATGFNQDIHLWDVENATNYSGFYSGTSLSNDYAPCKFYGNCTLDTDGDGVYDHLEVYNDTDPLNPSSN